MMEKLKGCLVKVSDLTEQDRIDMFNLMNRFYENIRWQIFLEDLTEKENVILLRDNINGDIKGFSTVMLLKTIVENIPVVAVFSGDTIIDKEYWGEQKLVQLIGRYFLEVVDNNPGSFACWFLISKGYKTYRYLPLYFREFYPHYVKKTPLFEQAVIDTLSAIKYGKFYNKENGIVCNGDKADVLKNGIADIGKAQLVNPHVRFFVKKNPGYVKGEELACIAQLSKQNFQKMFLRIVTNYKKISV